MVGTLQYFTQNPPAGERRHGFRSPQGSKGTGRSTTKPTYSQ